MTPLGALRRPGDPPDDAEVTRDDVMAMWSTTRSSTNRWLLVAKIRPKPGTGISRHAGVYRFGDVLAGLAALGIERDPALRRAVAARAESVRMGDFPRPTVGDPDAYLARALAGRVYEDVRPCRCCDRLVCGCPGAGRRAA